MGETRAKTKEHIKAEEDQTDKIHAKREALMFLTKVDRLHPRKTHHRQGGKSDTMMTQFTPLKLGRAQILEEACHMQLLDIPPPTGGTIKR
ncbi:hypothetical protein CR513_25447, partial [Mucuna pruriens]